MRIPLADDESVSQRTLLLGRDSTAAAHSPNKVTECAPSGPGVLERPRYKKLPVQQLKPIQSSSSPQHRKQCKNEVTPFLDEPLEPHHHSQ
jgi:hypothetical protein